MPMHKKCRHGFGYLKQYDHLVCTAMQAARFKYLPISTPSIVAGGLRRTGGTPRASVGFAGRPSLPTSLSLCAHLSVQTWGESTLGIGPCSLDCRALVHSRAMRHLRCRRGEVSGGLHLHRLWTVCRGEPSRPGGAVCCSQHI